MPDKHEPNPNASRDTAGETIKRTTGRRWFSKGGRVTIALLTGAVIVVGGAYGVQAVTGSKAYGHFRVSMAQEGGWHGGGHMSLAEMSDADIEDRVERMVGHLAIEIDATPEQQDEIIALVTAVAKDLRPMRDRLHATGMELKHLLTADTIDRAALEALRAARLAEADQISKTLVGAVADVADVLTPEQREVVQALIRDSRAKRREHHRG